MSYWMDNILVHNYASQEIEKQHFGILTKMTMEEFLRL